MAKSSNGPAGQQQQLQPEAAARLQLWLEGAGAAHSAAASAEGRRELLPSLGKQLWGQAPHRAALEEGKIETVNLKEGKRKRTEESEGWEEGTTCDIDQRL